MTLITQLAATAIIATVSLAVIALPLFLAVHVYRNNAREEMRELNGYGHGFLLLGLIATVLMGLVGLRAIASFWAVQS